MADDFSDEMLSTGEDAANTEFDKQLKKGSSAEDAVKAGIKVGAQVTATAACAATGVGAVVAPLCGWLGGEVIGPIVSAIGDVVDWIGDLFSDPPPVTHLIVAKDLEGIDPATIKTNQRIVAYLKQAARVDYILAKRYLEVVTRVADAITALGATPDPDRIQAKLGERLPLTYYGNYGWGDKLVQVYVIPDDLRESGETGYDWTWTLGTTPPDCWQAATAIQGQLSSGSISPAQCIAAIEQVFQNAAKWSDQLNVEAARVLMLVGLGTILDSGMTTVDPRSIAPHAREMTDKQKRVVTRAVALAMSGTDTTSGFSRTYLFQKFHVVNGIQFLKV